MQRAHPDMAAVRVRPDRIAHRAACRGPAPASRSRRTTTGSQRGTAERGPAPRRQHEYGARRSDQQRVSRQPLPDGRRPAMPAGRDVARRLDPLHRHEPQRRSRRRRKSALDGGGGSARRDDVGQRSAEALRFVHFDGPCADAQRRTANGNIHRVPARAQSHRCRAGAQRSRSNCQDGRYLSMIPDRPHRVATANRVRVDELRRASGDPQPSIPACAPLVGQLCAGGYAAHSIHSSKGSCHAHFHVSPQQTPARASR